MEHKDYKDNNLWLMQGDCLERMRELEDCSVDLILCDTIDKPTIV